MYQYLWIHLVALLFIGKFGIGAALLVGAMDHLVAIKVGEELTVYEVQKREAIQKEDYNLAEEKRLQSEMCRQQAFKRLDLSALLTESGSLEEQSSLQLLHPVKVQDTVVELQPIKTEHDSKTLHDTPDQDYHHDNQDDRPLPTLNK